MGQEVLASAVEAIATAVAGGELNQEDKQEHMGKVQASNTGVVARIN